MPRPGPDQWWCRCTPAASAAPTSTSCATAGASSPAPWPATSGPGPSPPWATTSRTGPWASVSSVGRRPSCGTCRRCQEGKPSQCENRSTCAHDNSDGAFAEFILVRAAGVLRLPEGLSARHAALAEPLAVALHGITRSGIAPGDSAMVIGAGPIGALDRGRAAGHGRRPTSRWSSRTRAAGAWPPTSGPPRSSTLPSSRPSRPGSPRSISSPCRPCRARVLGQEGGHRGRLPSAAPGRHAGDGGRGH